MSSSDRKVFGIPPAFSKSRRAEASTCRRALDELRHRSAILRQRIEQPFARHDRPAREKLCRTGERPRRRPDTVNGELHVGDTACAQSGAAYRVYEIVKQDGWD